ncbi:hypothetical protein D8B22_10765 [Verminephrobacter aporrectodeae subsp. tuberculatae]|uniref:type IV toxin-antitoxin system AbiEi family antitoxin domain-containing protein n=1 Tax=Verminephrobacter aporrectodeae TaxID=1110389 RepID=UPI002244596D|nr:hypothetical protein [Verminephrobacter aporrectodeae]MCW8165565.1 hypothetical protein [Verminephrobacter aporrectodeae subsp. tuberculatae]MCW8169576.1 hypothetical protein [Verminephrobacter aporrectodeae subsp. tuberculatae]
MESTQINSNTDPIGRLVAKLANSLASTSAAAITTYELAMHVYSLLNDVQDLDPKKAFQDVLQSLLAMHLLTPMNHVVPKAYFIFGRSSAVPADVVCSLDPFSYVSHLSAMEYYGLTDRFPQILYMTRPSAPEWRRQATARTAKDLGHLTSTYENSGLPRMTQPKISKIGRTSIQFCERTQWGAFRLVSGSRLRVATIGRVFLDMLREPIFCGGIQHVIDIYRREAKKYLKLIVDEVDRHGKPIDKIRIGYLLSEVCKLNPPEMTSWQQFAKRGGSRKLDPECEYAPRYSERWMLSINVPSLTLPEDEDG